MMSVRDALRLTGEKLDEMIEGQVDRFRISLKGERDRDAERKVGAYEVQLAAWKTETMAEIETWIMSLSRKILH